MAAQWQDGRIKFALTHRLLTLRRERPALFRDGEYVPIEVEGAGGDHVIAFARRHKNDAVIIAVARHFAPFTSGGTHWPNFADCHAELRPNGFDIVADHLNPQRAAGSQRVADLFASLPVAVLRATARG
jgi:(1->4)-alpha-D-glucan 1-alpha-D-glucosylmutase